MAWTTPKTDWTTADGVDYTDLNEIGANLAFIATNPSGNDLQLAPDGGSVSIKGGIGTESFTIGSGGFRVKGTDGDIVVDSTSNRFNFSRAGLNGIRAFSTGGYYAIVTNGRSFTEADANFVFNANKSNTSNGMFTINGTAGDIFLQATGDRIDFTKAGENGLRASNIGGYFNFVTNGNSIGDANATLSLLADKTVIARSIMLVNTGANPYSAGLNVGADGMSVIGTTDDVIIDSTGLLKVTRFLADGTNWDVSIAATGQLTTGYLQVDDAPIGLYTSSVQYGYIGESGGNDLIIRALKSTGEIVLQSHSAGMIRMKNYVFCEDNLNITAGNVLVVNTINESTASVGVTFIAEANFDDVVNCSAEVKFKYYYSATTVTYGDIYDELATVITTTGDVLILDGYIIAASDKYRVFSARRYNTTIINVKVVRVDIDDTFEELQMSTGTVTSVSSVKLTANYDKV